MTKAVPNMVLPLSVRVVFNRAPVTKVMSESSFSMPVHTLSVRSCPGILTQTECQKGSHLVLNVRVVFVFSRSIL